MFLLNIGENGDKDRLGPLPNVKLLVMEKEIGPRFPGFTIPDQDKHEVHRKWENKGPIWNATKVLRCVFWGASRKA